jgi:hypothetical protein
MKQSTKIHFIAITRGFHALLPCRAAVVPQDPHLCVQDHPPAPQGDQVRVAQAATVSRDSWYWRTCARARRSPISPPVRDRRRRPSVKPSAQPTLVRTQHFPPFAKMTRYQPVWWFACYFLPVPRCFIACRVGAFCCIGCGRIADGRRTGGACSLWDARSACSGSRNRNAAVAGRRIWDPSRAAVPTTSGRTAGVGAVPLL